MLGALLPVLIFTPLLMSFLGIGLVLSKNVAGVYILFATSMTSSLLLMMLYTLTPTALQLFAAKLKKKTLLLVWLENGIIKPFIGNFSSGFIWIGKRLGYLVSGPEDRGFIDGVPIYLAYWGVGKTLQPKAMADITLLEKYGISSDYLRARLEEQGILPIIDINEEGELVERYPAREVEVEARGAER